VVLTLGQSISYPARRQRLPPFDAAADRYFERRHVGDLLSRIGSISPIQSMLAKGMVNMLIDSGPRSRRSS
jgi:ATP-binding cassette subfamily B protein RaxB